MSAPTDIRPFSNGTEGYDWLAANCDRCQRNGPFDANGEGPCPMETAISRGFLLGTVPTELAVQYGAIVETRRMPRQCSQFIPPATCEYVRWPGTRRARKCHAPATAEYEYRGLRRAVCAKHAAVFREPAE